MNMQNAAPVAEKVVILEEFRQILAEKPIPCLTPDVEQRLVRKLTKRLKDPQLVKDVWKDIVAELWPKKPEAPKAFAIGNVVDFPLGEPRKRSNSKQPIARSLRTRPKKPVRVAEAPVTRPVKDEAQVKVSKPKSEKQAKIEPRERRRLRRLAKLVTKKAGARVMEDQQANADRRKAKKESPVVSKSAVGSHVMAPGYLGELQQPVAKVSLETEAPKAFKPPAKRKSFRARVAPADQAWWDSICTDGYLVTFWLKHFGLKETYWLAGDDQEHLVESMWFKLHPPVQEEETEFDRKLREAEEALAAERALRQPDATPEAPKPKGKKKRESKLEGAEKSRQQAELQEQREKQKAEAQANPETKPEATDVVSLAKVPPVKHGRTKKQEALEAKKRKPKRHAKSAPAAAIVKTSKRGELVSQLLQERIRDLIVELKATDMYLPMAADMQDAFQAYNERAAMALSRAQAGHSVVRNITKAEDNILYMLELSELAYHTDVDTFGTGRFRLGMEMPSVNLLLTLAAMVARVFRSPSSPYPCG